MKDRAIVRDEQGVRRFRANRIVRDLLDAATEGRRYDLNEIWRQAKGHGKYTLPELQELYQLIGYSLDGYGEIFPYSKERA